MVLQLALAPAAVAQTQAPYGFLLRLGADTVAVERVTPTPDGFIADLLERAPRVVHYRYEVRADTLGKVKRLEIALHVANPAGRPVVRTLLERAGAADPRSAYTLRLWRGDSLMGTRDTSFTGDIAPWLLYGSAAYEWSFGVVRRQGGDSAVIATLSHGATRLGRQVLRRTGPTTYTYPFFLGQKFYATLDPNGRLIGFSGRETTIKVELERLPVAPQVESILAAWTSRELEVGIARDLSVRDTANVTLGGAAVTVDYGRPLSRRRTVLGGIVPLNEVWRTGANAATHLTLSAPMLVGGKLLAAGTYTLWTLPTPSGVTLLVNSQRGVWGTAYDAAKDLLRVPLEVRASAAFVERMTIGLEPDAQGRIGLRVLWGNIDWLVLLECTSPSGEARSCR